MMHIVVGEVCVSLSPNGEIVSRERLFDPPTIRRQREHLVRERSSHEGLTGYIKEM